MDNEHLITALALSSMAVGSFLVYLNNNISTAVGGLAFGLGFATISTQIIAKLESSK